MINFFRGIRKSFINNGNISKYFKYAIGEIFLVMLGILLALQVNNWNENRKLNIKKNVLLQDLLSDFEVTKTRLKSSIDYTKNSVKTINTFLSVATINNNHISLDSLHKLSESLFYQTFFRPLLSTYERALSTGQISLIKNKIFLAELPKFFQAYENFDIHDKLGGDLVFKGSVWELRKETGSVNILFQHRKNNNFPKKFELSEKEYRSLIAQKKFMPFMKTNNGFFRIC